MLHVIGFPVLIGGVAWALTTAGARPLYVIIASSPPILLASGAIAGPIPSSAQIILTFARRSGSSRRGRAVPGRAFGSWDVNNVRVPGWVVYILECGDGTLYTGITIDLRRRLASHQSGTASKYTRARLPVKLIHREAHRSRSSALRREALIKKMTRRDKLGLIRSSPS